MSADNNLHNYEITVILPPSSKEEGLHTLLKSSFPNSEYSIETLGERELAYKIGGVSSVRYYVVDVVANTTDIKDFQRRATYSKEILRYLVINLEKERGLHRDFPINFKARQIAKILRREEEQELAERQDERDELFQEEGSEGELRAEVNQATSSLGEEESEEVTGDSVREEEVEERVRFSEIFEEQLDIQSREFGSEEEDNNFDIKQLFLSMGFKVSDIPDDIEEQIERLRERDRLATAAEEKPTEELTDQVTNP